MLQLGEGDPTRGKAHLVAHHAALQQRSYLSALRSLHRFFDYNAGATARRLIARRTVTLQAAFKCTLPEGYTMSQWVRDLSFQERLCCSYAACRLS